MAATTNTHPETSGSGHAKPLPVRPAPTSGSGHAKQLPVRPALCSHIMATGATCGCPAVKGTKLCFHHSAVKSALGRVTPIDQVPYGTFAPIPFVFAEDAASLQINYHLLLQAVAENRVEHRPGTLMFRILHAMAANLKNPLIAQNPADAAAPPIEEIWEQNDDTELTSTEQEIPSASSLQSVVKSEPDHRSDACAGAPHLEQKWDQNHSAPRSDSSDPRSHSDRGKRARPADDPELQAAIEALPPTSKLSVKNFLAQRDYLSDAELQYFSLPPYHKPENKPELRTPAPLNSSVQRIIALSCERP